MDKTISKRGGDSFVDLLKGIGICLVVIGHSGFEYRNVIYLFHMALFFIVSGYCYKEKKISMQSWIVKKLKTLWIPNFVSVLAVSGMANVLLKLHIVSADACMVFTVKNFVTDIIKAFFFGGGRQLLGANWFLRTLFLGLVLYEIVNRLLLYLRHNKRLFRIFIFVFFLIFGWLLTEWRGHGMYFNVLSVPILLEIGRIIKDKDLINGYRQNKCRVILGFVCFIGLVILSEFGSITMNYNVITNPPFFIVCSLLGFFLCVSIADFIFRYEGISKRFIIYAGRHSLTIMLLHFLSFKIVTLLQIVLFGEKIEVLSAYPVHVSSNGWWIAYSIAGISIPCLLLFVFGKLEIQLKSIK